VRRRRGTCSTGGWRSCKCSDVQVTVRKCGLLATDQRARVKSPVHPRVTNPLHPIGTRRCMGMVAALASKHMRDNLNGALQGLWTDPPMCKKTGALVQHPAMQAHSIHTQAGVCRGATGCGSGLHCATARAGVDLAEHIKRTSRHSAVGGAASMLAHPHSRGLCYVLQADACELQARFASATQASTH